MNGTGRDDDGDPGGDRWEDPDDGVMRGWIPPDDRLWRHPSESGARATGPYGPAAPPAPSARRGAGPRAAGAVTACAIVAFAATGVAMVTTRSSGQPRAGAPGGIAALVAEPTTEPGAGHIPREPALAGMVATARESVVALQVGTATGTATGTGIVAESGGIIVTSSQLLSGARSVTAVEANGTRQAADIVGIDRTADVAVLRIADDLPAASFDVADPAAQSIEVALALRAQVRSNLAPSAKVYAGTVASAGRAVDSDQPAAVFSDPVVEAPLTDGDIGCPLLDRGGQVWGMLEWTDRSGEVTAAVFLPAEVVLGVTQQLVSSGGVDHGWLGVEASDARSPAAGGDRTTGTAPATGTEVTTAATAVTTAATAPSPTVQAEGARIDSVDTGSPAAGAGLRDGDVIVGIDGSPIQSASELDTRLYPDAPGTALDLSVVRDGSMLTAPVVLADHDSDDR